MGGACREITPLVGTKAAPNAISRPKSNQYYLGY